MLRIEDLHKSFGGLSVVAGLNLAVGAGETRCIIGPNGTGKTTLFNLITGRFRADSGRIVIAGREVTRLKVHQISRLGVARKIQSPSVFEEMTVFKNLLVGGCGRRRIGDLLMSRRPPDLRDRAEAILERFQLQAQRNTRAADLSHGQKQWLEIGMVMLNDPTLILLDEPTAGMTLPETARTADLIRTAFKGKTAIIIEHDIAFVRRLDTKVTVLYRGSVMREGPFDEIAADESVRRVYLGDEA